MSEIPSAEELALKIERISQMRCENPDCKVCAAHKKEAADLIRARDKAWVDRIRERLGLIIMPDTMIGAFYSKAIDDVLRELGGEQ